MFIPVHIVKTQLTAAKYMSEITEMDKCKPTIVSVVAFVCECVCVCVCNTCSISVREEYECNQRVSQKQVLRTEGN